MKITNNNTILLKTFLTGYGLMDYLAIDCNCKKIKIRKYTNILINTKVDH